MPPPRRRGVPEAGGCGSGRFPRLGIGHEERRLIRHRALGRDVAFEHLQPSGSSSNPCCNLCGPHTSYKQGSCRGTAGKWKLEATPIRSEEEASRAESGWLRQY